MARQQALSSSISSLLASSVLVGSSHGPSECVPGRSSRVPERLEWDKGYKVGS